MKKAFLAILAILVLVSACSTSTPPTPQPQSVYSNPANYIGWGITITQFDGELATIQIGDEQIIVGADEIMAYNQIIFNNGVSIVEERISYTTGMPTNPPVITGILQQVVVSGDYVTLWIDNYSQFSPTPQDLQVQAAWPIFVEQATKGDFPITVLDEKFQAEESINQCQKMGFWSSILPWLRPYTPSFCLHPSQPTFSPGGPLVTSIEDRNDTVKLQCGRISPRYSILKIDLGYEAPFPFKDFKRPINIKVFDHKTGEENIYTVPGLLPLAIDYPDEYQGWADPPIQWYSIGREACEIDTPIASGEYSSPKQQYLEIQVPNERYRSPTCIAYRALGGAGSPSNPNWDPQCESPTHTERIPVP